MIETNTPEIQFALQIATQVARLLRRIQDETVTEALTKEDRSPVTLADFAAQALVGRALEQAFPADALVGEEGADALRSPDGQAVLAQVTRFVSDSVPGAQPAQILAWIDRGQAGAARRFWTLDPMDGTKGFLRGDQYAVAFALLVDYQVQIGVLGCPRLVLPGSNFGEGCLVLAARGQGCWAAPLEGKGNWIQLHVSPQQDVREARILRSFESGHTNVDQIGQFAGALGIQAEPVRLDSQAKAALLANGTGEIMLRMLSAKQPNYREKIWDQAAGSLVIEEAGGRVSDLDGRPLDFSTGRTLENNRGVLASNGALYAAALAALRQVGA